jgi:hypothetical protein
MHTLTPAALRWLAGHHGVITRTVLRRSGVGQASVNRLVRADVLRTAHKGVYVLAATKPTLEQRCAVLSAAHPSGFVTGPTAGVLLNLRRMPSASSLHFAVRHGLHLPPELGVILHQTTALPPCDRRERHDGIAVASPDRLAFDLVGVLPVLDQLSAVHQLLHERRVTVGSLLAIGRRLCHPARVGSAQFVEVLARIGGAAPAHSHPEVVLAEALRERAVPVERQTHLLRGADGRRTHVDLAVAEIRWGIELDIHPEHRTVEGHAGDARRYRSLHLVDWQIEPVSERDMENPSRLADELTALYHARRRQVLAHPSVS